MCAVTAVWGEAEDRSRGAALLHPLPCHLLNCAECCCDPNTPAGSCSGRRERKELEGINTSGSIHSNVRCISVTGGFSVRERGRSSACSQAACTRCWMFAWAESFWIENVFYFLLKTSTRYVTTSHIAISNLNSEKNRKLFYFSHADFFSKDDS